ncbi:hypothetical protein L484_011447 [Morus notabilis]|uniref:Uncharacterized protein n=1 Tax=Morus notabilis TaxID=981085 RepID=W9R5R3_9ROSA|nr:hypothetical protein L484_011447 [Morus notabilis]
MKATTKKGRNIGISLAPLFNYNRRRSFGLFATETKHILASQWRCDNGVLPETRAAK